MTQTRREFLRSGVVTATVAGLGLDLSGDASATDPDQFPHTSAIPEHVSLTFDESWLARYRPRLSMSSADRELFLTTRAWKASSPEYDTDVGVYWQTYVGQNGVTSYDSHKGDHEPVYVFVDDSSGDVQHVAASVYHWLKGSAPPGVVPMAEATHPALRVIEPWHQHTAATTDAGFYPEVTPLGTSTDIANPDATTVFEAWLENGLAGDLGVGVVTEPWSIQARESWWRRDLGPISWTSLYVSARRLAGIGEVGSLRS